MPALAATTPARALRLAERRDGVVGPADLERARPLEVLGLQEDLAPGEPRERLGRVERRLARDACEAVARSLDVSDRRRIEPEHLLHDLADGAQRIELACLDLREDALKLRILCDRGAEMRASRDWTRRRTPPTARFLRRRSSRRPSRSSAARCSSTADQQLGNVLAGQRLRQQDHRRCSGSASPTIERTSFSIVFAAGCSILLIAITSGISMIPAFSACTESPEPGISTSTHRVRDPGHLDLALPRTHGLDEDDVLPGRVEQEHGLQRRLGKPAEVAARAHRADVDAGVEKVIRQADAVAEERAARERARRIDRDDADRPLGLAHEPDERADETRLADARRPGDADDRGAARCSGRARARADRRARRRPRRARSHARARADRGANARDELLERQLLARHAAALYAHDALRHGARSACVSGGLGPFAPFSARAEPRSPRGAWRCARGALVARRSPRSLLVDRHVAVAERGDRATRSSPRSRPSLLRRRDGEPSRHDQRNERGDEIHDAARPARPPARRRASVSTPAAAMASPSDGVVRAHDRRERATPVLVRSAALDEQPVADDDGAVPGGAADDEGDGEPDRAGSAPRRPSPRP